MMHQRVSLLGKWLTVCASIPDARFPFVIVISVYSIFVYKSCVKK